MTIENAKHVAATDRCRIKACKFQPSKEHFSTQSRTETHAATLSLSYLG
jgi:hypothetical protein